MKDKLIQAAMEIADREVRGKIFFTVPYISYHSTVKEIELWLGGPYGKIEDINLQRRETFIVCEAKDVVLNILERESLKERGYIE